MRFFAAFLALVGLALIGKTLLPEDFFLSDAYKKNIEVPFLETSEMVKDKIDRVREKVNIYETDGRRDKNGLENPDRRIINKEKDINQKVSGYLKCLSREEPCEGFNKESPRTYLLGVLEAMESDLQSYYFELKTHPNRIDYRRDQSLARRLVETEYPTIQVIGFRFLNLFPPSRENLEVMSSSLSRTFYEGVLEEGLETLKLYRSRQEFDPVITEMLTQQIRYGVNDGTASHAAQRLFPYLNEENFQHYARVAEELPSHLRRTRALKAALYEFERSL